MEIKPGTSASQFGMVNLITEAVTNSYEKILNRNNKIHGIVFPPPCIIKHKNV